MQDYQIVSNSGTMKNEKKGGTGWLAYLRKNWFNLTLVALLLFVFLKKDLSFQFNLNAPARINQPLQEKYDNSPNKTQKSTKKGIYTQKQPQKTILDKFELPYIGRMGKKYDPALELEKLDHAIKLAYIKRFSHVAISERKKYGIPSSIILASAMLHSQAGQTEMAQLTNNQFAISCASGWGGKTEQFGKKCYRKYDNAWMSFRDHSQYITSGNFAKLTKLDPADYKAWAKGLDRQGFSKYAKNLEESLIQIIEHYKLHALDFE